MEGLTGGFKGCYIEPQVRRDIVNGEWMQISIKNLVLDERSANLGTQGCETWCSCLNLDIPIIEHIQHKRKAPSIIETTRTRKAADDLGSLILCLVRIFQQENPKAAACPLTPY